jgi:hypothetical protein
MIHQVPMKSLPQEWLWCETWCDDASKPAAKTIDLVSSTMDTGATERPYLLSLVVASSKFKCQNSNALGSLN